VASCPCGARSSSRVSMQRHRKHCGIAKLAAAVVEARGESVEPFELPAATLIPRHRWARIVELVEALEHGAP
jgi:hypothetical protein